MICSAQVETSKTLVDSTSIYVISKIDEVNRGVFNENLGNMAEMHHDSLLNLWQLPYSTQPITASSADMFPDWP
jgi:hypothetical protein